MMFIGSVFAADENPYAKFFSLTIAYQNEGEGSFLVTLKNTSDKKLLVSLNGQEVEGEFFVFDGKEQVSSFYDRDYLRKLLTSWWLSGSSELAPAAEIKWTVTLDELVYFGAGDKAVTKERLKGKTISLSLDRLDVFPALGESNVGVKITSNAVEIP
jgi:hypothetical protein